MIRIRQIKIPYNERTIENIKKKVSKKLNIKLEEIKHI